MALITDNLCFFHMPKTGGLWIRSVLKSTFPETRERGHVHAPPDEVPLRIEQPLLRFCFVRNPLAWFPSLWSHKQRVDPQWLRPFASHTVLRGRLLLDLGQTAESFSQFMDRYLDLGIPILSEEFQRYSRGCDRIGRFESLEQDLRTICAEAGLPLPERLPPAVNSSPLEHLAECVWTPEQIDRLRELERGTFERFGYGTSGESRDRTLQERTLDHAH
ncbi:hypothetical protein SH661x_004650 [Planctomicrobium sp. SH661]|uniref:hypothetical protein n=1 Tax=Planctomicrobium sp. SH661 TaxID=3448124 RepID=UPI003F5C3603